MKHYLLTGLLEVICCCAFGSELLYLEKKIVEHSSSTIDYFDTDSVQPRQEEDRMKQVRFGLKGGMNLTNMNFNKGHSGVNVRLGSAWEPGFALGLVMQVHLSGRLYFTQEYLLSRVRGQYKPFEAHYTLDYLSTPILLHYQITPKLMVAVGPQLEILLQGKEAINGKISKVTQLTEERSIGVTMGLTYLFSDRISFNGRFMHGLNHIGIYQRAGRREFKFELVQVSANVLF